MRHEKPICWQRALCYAPLERSGRRIWEIDEKRISIWPVSVLWLISNTLFPLVANPQAQATWASDYNINAGQLSLLFLIKNSSVGVTSSCLSAKFSCIDRFPCTPQITWLLCTALGGNELFEFCYTSWRWTSLLYYYNYSLHHARLIESTTSIGSRVTNLGRGWYDVTNPSRGVAETGMWHRITRDRDLSLWTQY